MTLAPSVLIQRKRDGKELTPEQIRGFVRGLSSGDVADYQASAFLMAVYFKGMTLSETVALTEAMLESGDRYDLSKVVGPKVDKHSTGGVGDKVSLILAPLAAACGLKVPMMSGRGLGHTGGTADKLESIPGFDINLGLARFEEVLSKVGCAMITQTDRIAPADKKLYALRDVTATIECLPLITASILSKKLAEGTDALVLDIKVGNGAFMKSREQARRLSKTMIQVARKMGVPCRALLTDMSQPLGYAAGHSLEVVESIEVLRDKHGLLSDDTTSGDLKEVTVQLCAHMLELGGVSKSLADGRKLAHARLADGSAWKKFQELVREQKGSGEAIEKITKLPISSNTVTWRARKKGFMTSMDTEELGRILVELGGGRKKVTDRIDYSVGFVFHRKLGATIKTGDPLVTVYLPEKLRGAALAPLEESFHESVDITRARKPVPKLILEVIGK